MRACLLQDHTLSGYCRKAVARVVSSTLLLAILTFATAPAAAQSPSTAGPAPSTVRVATTPSIATVVLLTLQGNGTLDKIGSAFHTRITLNTSLGSTDVTNQFAAGNFDVMFVGIQHAPRLVAQKQDAVQLMSIISGGGVYVVGDIKYRAQRGTDLKKWAGANFADNGLGSQVELWLDALLHRAGVANYHKTHLSTEALYPAMMAGRVDGYAADAGTAAAALVNNAGYIIADSNTPEADKIFGAALPSANMVARHEFIDSYPQLTQALVTALLSQLKALSAPEVTFRQVQAQLPPTLYKNDTKTFPVIWKLAQPGLQNETGLYTKARYEAVVAVLHASNQIKAGDPNPPISMINNSFVLKAYQDLRLTAPAGAL